MTLKKGTHYVDALGTPPSVTGVWSMCVTFQFRLATAVGRRWHTGMHYKGRPNNTSSAFLSSVRPLLSVCVPDKIEKVFTKCELSCRSFLTPDDTHELCVICLGWPVPWAAHLLPWLLCSFGVEGEGQSLSHGCPDLAFRTFRSQLLTLPQVPAGDRVRNWKSLPGPCLWGVEFSGSQRSLS